MTIHNLARGPQTSSVQLRAETKANERFSGGGSPLALPPSGRHHSPRPAGACGSVSRRDLRRCRTGVLVLLASTCRSSPVYGQESLLTAVACPARRFVPTTVIESMTRRYG